MYILILCWCNSSYNFIKTFLNFIISYFSLLLSNSTDIEYNVGKVIKPEEAWVALSTLFCFKLYTLSKTQIELNKFKPKSNYFIGNGYCRSEGIVAIYIQKESEAKRIYCSVVHSKNNSDGNKSQGNYAPLVSSCNSWENGIWIIYMETFLPCWFLLE